MSVLDQNTAVARAGPHESLVLLIEDDADQRTLASLIIWHAGHRVRVAADGATGVQLAHELQPDAIVCDVMLPDMSGYQVIEAVRADPAVALTPAVLVTALSDHGHMRRGMTAGADDYLSKPYRPEELSQAVAAALARGKVRQNAFAGRMAQALHDQQQTLAYRYEKQLEHELNARWIRNTDAGGVLQFADAIVVEADLLGAGRSAATDSRELAQRVRRVAHAARDTMYLFGAEWVLPHGSAFLSVFTRQNCGSSSAELCAVRAAFALANQAPDPRAASIGVPCGTVELVRVDDALHGEGGQALVPGPALSEVAAVRSAGAALGWRVAASPAVARALAGQLATGVSVGTALGGSAVRILPPGHHDTARR